MRPPGFDPVDRGRRARLGAAIPRVAATIVVLTTLFLGACRPDLVVRLATRVYHDGSVDRVLEIRGRTSDGEVPTKDDWFAADVGLTLASPDAWARVVREPALIRAEGFFTGVDQLPPLLRFSSEHGTRSDRMATELRIEDRVVIRRWVYRERHADPYSQAEIHEAMRGLTDLLVEVVDHELRREFGDSFDTAPAATFLQTEAIGLGSSLLSVRRQTAGVQNYRKRTVLWEQVLAQYGIARRPHDPDERDFWERHAPAVIDWIGDGVARSLSSGTSVLRREQLSFWPTGDIESMGATLEELIERTWEDQDELTELVGPYIAALFGYYGAETTPRFRFHSGVRLPGTLLRTNGTPTAQGVAWILRTEDLAYGDRFLDAESVEVNDAALKQLGARRSFSHDELIQLVDLLWTRDPEGVLLEWLRAAHAAAGLEQLAGDDTPETYAAAILELFELLDPERESPAPLM